MDVEVILQHDIPTASAYAILTVSISSHKKSFDCLVKAVEKKLSEIEGVSLSFPKDFHIKNAEELRSLFIQDCHCPPGIGVSN